jgi:hypothetical protein
MSTALSVPKLVGARRYVAFYERFLESLAQLRGVSAAGAASNLPWTGAKHHRCEADANMVASAIEQV